MRLNRVLQSNRVPLLVATISMMMFALVFTSCSGDDGKNGKNGENCTIDKQDEGVYKVLCGGDEVGTLQSPGDSKGDQGDPGNDGNDGKDGPWCQIDDSYNIRCGGELKGNLSACKFTAASGNEEFETQVACKSTNPSAKDSTKFTLCASKAGVDPGFVRVLTATQACPIGGLASGATPGAAVAPVICADGSKLATGQYCGLAKFGGKATALPLCGNAQEYLSSSSSYSASKMANKIELEDVTEAQCNAKPAGTGTSASSIGTWAENGDSGTKKCWIDFWDNEYCQFVDKEHSRVVGVETNIEDDGAEGFCGAVWNHRGEILNASGTGISETTNPSGFSTELFKYAYNNGKWEGKYCGYQAPTTAKPYLLRKIYSNSNTLVVICDDFENILDLDHLPNGKEAGKGYCQFSKDGSSLYSESTCGDGSTINGGTKWDAQYCGYASATAAKTSSIGKAGGTSGKNLPACDEGSAAGPHANGWNHGYCTVYFEDAKRGTTTYTEDWCRKDDATTTTATAKINENKWNGDYCGYDMCTVKDENNKNVKVVCDYAFKKYTAQACSDGTGPNAATVTNNYCRAVNATNYTINDDLVCGDGSKVNEGTWKGEYCGYADAEDELTTKFTTGACRPDATDLSGDLKGPHSDKPDGGYCQANRSGSIAYTTEFCGESGKVNENEWNFEYCGVSEDGADTVFPGICGDDNGPNSKTFNGGYCQWVKFDDVTTTYVENVDGAGLCDGTKYNEGAWKGEKCYADNKVAACTGGRVPADGKLSTDDFTVRCIFPSGPFICSESNPAACNSFGCADLGDGWNWIASANECRAVVASN